MQPFTHPCQWQKCNFLNTLVRCAKYYLNNAKLTPSKTAFIVFSCLVCWWCVSGRFILVYMLSVVNIINIHLIAFDIVARCGKYEVNRGKSGGQTQYKQYNTIRNNVTNWTIYITPFINLPRPQSKPFPTR